MFPMSVLQFKCNDCSAVFECLSGIEECLDDGKVGCLCCESNNFSRLTETQFSPKKDFCPRGTGCRRAGV